MSVLTENDIRKLVADGLLKEKGDIFVEKDTILTPSAKTYLLEKNIAIKEGQRAESTSGQVTEMKEQMYETVFGLKLNDKPEHMTHLRGTTLVFKDHPKIRLRGAIDTLESEIIIAQTVAKRLNKPKVIDDLEEVIRFIRRLLRCEVTGEAVGEMNLQGLGEQEIREQSYHPSKYFGMKHFLPTYKHGEMVAHLNRLRTLARETELIAFQAFKDNNYQMERVDIIQAFNRLSSLFWIMMFKDLTGKYD